LLVRRRSSPRSVSRSKPINKGRAPNIRNG
jgi:hypothetical protein